MSKFGANNALFGIFELEFKKKTSVIFQVSTLEFV